MADPSVGRSGVPAEPAGLPAACGRTPDDEPRGWEEGASPADRPAAGRRQERPTLTTPMIVLAWAIFDQPEESSAARQLAREILTASGDLPRRKP